MKTQIQYYDEPMGNPRRVADFLPPASSLIMRKPPSNYQNSMQHRKVAEPTPPPYHT